MNVIEKLKKLAMDSQYYGFFSIIYKYWSIYGGIKAVVFSPYFHLSIAITYLMSGVWTQTGWWDHVLNIMPNILGFSLGGYAIWLAIGDEKFKSLIAGQDEDAPEESSPYMDISVAFVHFIFVQFAALTLALIALGSSIKWPFPDMTICFNDKVLLNTHDVKLWASCFAFLIFIYAIMTALAATFQILRYSIWYDDFQTENQDDEDTII